MKIELDCPVSCSGGCLEIDGYALTVANHFMDTYEIDSPGSDVQTGHLTFGTQIAAAECPSPAFCGSSISPWAYAEDVSTGVDAEAAVEITNGMFIDINGYCSQ